MFDHDRFQHTAARRRLQNRKNSFKIKYLCFNTQPPEGGCTAKIKGFKSKAGFNTQPPEGGCPENHNNSNKAVRFQHTAARRRLRDYLGNVFKMASFNTQPPEGGCHKQKACAVHYAVFQHTAARRRLPLAFAPNRGYIKRFNTQPPEGGCSLPKKARKISVLNTVFR